MRDKPLDFRLYERRRGCVCEHLDFLPPKIALLSAGGLVLSLKTIGGRESISSRVQSCPYVVCSTYPAGKHCPLAETKKRIGAQVVIAVTVRSACGSHSWFYYPSCCGDLWGVFHLQSVARVETETSAST